MTNTYTPARGERGQFLGGGRGDITGQKHLANAEEKARRDEGVKNTRNAISDYSKPVEIVTVDDAPYAVPRAVALAFIRAGMEMD